MKEKVAFLIVFAVVSMSPVVWGQSAHRNAITNLVVSGGYDDDIKPGKAKEEAMSREDVQKGLEGAAKDMFGEGAEAPAAEAPVETVEVSSQDTVGADFFSDKDKQEGVVSDQIFDTAGYIDKSFDFYGEVIDGEASNQYSFSFPELVYLNRGSADGVRVGDKFLIVHVDDLRIVHPVTGDYLGHRLLIDAVVEVKGTTDDVSEAMITRSYDSVERGDKVLPYDEARAPRIDPDKPVVEKTINGYLVNSKQEKSHYGQGDVVYFDVGKAAGVKPGDVFDIVDANDVVRKDGKIVPGLPKVIGKAMIISTRNDTSAAYIFASRNVIADGDIVNFAAER